MSRILQIPVLISGDRISRTELYLAIAKLQSMRSTCERGSNGAVITSDNRIIATGYNGSIQKGLSCGELQCDVTTKCQHAMHAEANAIAFAARSGTKLEGATIYCTSSPCYECAKLIIQAGISVVLFENEYKTDNGRGLQLLKSNHIEVYQK